LNFLLAIFWPIVHSRKTLEKYWRNRETNMKNKYNLILVLTAAFAFAASVSAQAPPGSLWYNGDADGRNGGANQDNGQLGSGEYSHLYDNFTGPSSGTWTVTGLFSDNIMDPNLPGAITTANWDIRTGVSVGNGGTVVFSGTTAATVTATGRNFFGRNEYIVEVTGLSLTLNALPTGQFYWLNVSPIVPIGVTGQSFQTTTSGLNAVGTPPGNDGNSFWNSNLFAMNFASSTALFGAGTWDVSEGVIGVPEPATVALLTCGLGALLIAARRRRGA
jgi:hypothetical protein